MKDIDIHNSRPPRHLAVTLCKCLSGLCLLAYLPITAGTASTPLRTDKINRITVTTTTGGFIGTAQQAQPVLTDLPRITYSMLIHYQPEMRVRHGTYISEIDSAIGPATLAEDRLWFGLVFGDGEGGAGLGGIGFYDPTLQRMGLLRHPALLGCSAKKIQVTASVISVLTYTEGEGETYVCNGLVNIDRATLTSTLQLPPPGVNHYSIHPDYGTLNQAEAAFAKLQDAPQDDLARQFAGLPKKTGPAMRFNRVKHRHALNLTQIMLAEDDFERDWFKKIMGGAKLVFDQRCELTAAQAPPDFADEAARQARRDAGSRTRLPGILSIMQVAQRASPVQKCTPAVSDIKFETENLISTSSYSTAHCRPAGMEYISIPIWNDQEKTWEDKDFYAQAQPRSGSAGRAFAREGYASDGDGYSGFPKEQSNYPRTFYQKISLEKVETIKIACDKNYEELSGSAIRSATVRQQIFAAD